MDELWFVPSLSHPTVAHTKATPRKNNETFYQQSSFAETQRADKVTLTAPLLDVIQSTFCNDNYVWLTFQCYQAVCCYFFCVSILARVNTLGVFFFKLVD